MPLQPRCHTIRPDRASGWLAYFELTPGGGRAGHFLVVGPSRSSTPEQRKIALLAGQAAVLYFKTTPDSAPPITLIDGAATLFQHEAETHGIQLSYGCGLLEDNRLWYRTQGDVRLVALGKGSGTAFEASTPDHVMVSTQDKFFFGRLSSDTTDAAAVRDEVQRLESGGGADGGLVLAFLEVDRRKAVPKSPTLRTAPRAVTPLVPPVVLPVTPADPPQAPATPEQVAEVESPAVDLPDTELTPIEESPAADTSTAADSLEDTETLPTHGSFRERPITEPTQEMLPLTAGDDESGAPEEIESVGKDPVDEEPAEGSAPASDGPDTETLEIPVSESPTPRPIFQLTEFDPPTEEPVVEVPAADTRAETVDLFHPLTSAPASTGDTGDFPEPPPDTEELPTVPPAAEPPQDISTPTDQPEEPDEPETTEVIAVPVEPDTSDEPVVLEKPEDPEPEAPEEHDEWEEPAVPREPEDTQVLEPEESVGPLADLPPRVSVMPIPPVAAPPEPVVMAGTDSARVDYASDETRGLGFWLGVASVIAVAAAFVIYLFVLRPSAPSPEGDDAPPMAEQIADPGMAAAVAPELRWEAGFDAAVTSSPLITSVGVVFGCRDGGVYCLDPASGDRVWAYAAADGFGSSPTLADDVVVIGGYDGTLYGLDSAGGEERWTYAIGEKIVASPRVAEGRVFIGAYDHHLHAVNAADGAGIWKANLGAIVWASPVVTDDLVLAASLDGTLHALDAATGRSLWTASLGGEVYSSPVVAERKVFLGSKDGHVYAFDLGSGEEVWKLAAGQPVNGSPAYNEGRLLVGVEDGTVLGIDVGLGEIVWSAATAGPIKSRPAFAGDTAWITSYDGTLYGIAWLTGEITHRFVFGAQAFSSPAVADGIAYFGTLDSRLLAVTLPGS